MYCLLNFLVKMKPENLLEWFTDELLPFAVMSGSFTERGDRQTLEKCEFEAAEKYVSSFASAPCFVKLKLNTPSGPVSRNVFVKFQSQDPIFREKMRTIPQFINEVTLYNEVYPCFVDFLNFCGQKHDFIDKVIPKCYFASAGNGDTEKAVLIIEDLRNDGFKLTESPTDLDLNHCLISVERLSRFHAISFAMKFKEWVPFEKLKHSFAEVFTEETPICRETCEQFQGYVANRGIDYLQSQNSEVPGEYLEKLRLILKPIFELMRGLYTPQEPLSVICHGDFNRNNLLFKYDNDELVDAKLIDYQRVFYGSPCLDLGFLIYMNTTLAFREKHFDEIFRYYYSNLVKNISVILNETEKSIADRIPIEALKEDFERVAIWHYVTVSFFLPIMMTPPNSDFESDFKNKTNKEMSEENYEKGGDVVSERIAELIVEFYRRKFYV